LLAIVKEERKPGAVVMRDVPAARPLEGEILIRVHSAAICGSDLHAYEYPPAYEFMKIPVILGHEYAGTVEAAGPGATVFRRGERVMGESNRFCGRCANCRTGRTNICENNLMTGLHVDGGMAEFIAVPENLVHRVPDNLSFEEAAVAQPCAVSFHAVYDNSAVVPGAAVAVFGAGVVGLTVAQAARLCGAAAVVVSGTGADARTRLPLARRMGFPTVDIDEEDLVAGFVSRTGRRRADAVLECSGSAAGIRDALRLVRKGGTVTLVGIYGQDAAISFAAVVRDEIHIKTSYTATWKNYEQALDLIAGGRVEVRPLITVYPFREGLQAFRDGLARAALKPVLQLA